MKNKILKIGVGLFLLLAFTSCEKWIDTGLNVDPNNPEKVSYSLVLPTIEAGLEYQFGGDLSRPTSIWMQQLSGVGNQSRAYDVYNYTQSDVDNVWRWGMYAGPLKDLKIMLDDAKADSSYHYLGIAQVLMAFSFSTMTDLFGDLPYAEAWDNNNLKPVFDSQESIYTALNKMLDDAIVNLAKTKSTFSPTTDDLIYGGDLAKWTMAAYAVKARLAIHLSKVNGASAYNSALTAINSSFASNDDDFFFKFGNNSNEWNPMYQYFIYERPGDVVMGAFLVDTLRNDPRFNVYIDTTGASEDPMLGLGSNPGKADGAANLGAYFLATDAPIQFITYAEIKFIEAEAKLQTSDLAGAATAYNEAVKAALAKYGVSDAAWEAKYANETAGTINLSKIISQKYIALFMQPEIFTDYRRTGFPVITPPSDAKTVDKKLPRRFPYSTSEKNYNGANFEKYESVTISTPVWWDK